MRYWFKLFLLLLLSASCAKNEFVTYRDQIPRTEDYYNPELIAKTIYSHFYDKTTKGTDLLPLSSNTLRDSLATVVNFQDNGYYISQTVILTTPTNGSSVYSSTDSLQGAKWGNVQAMNYNIHPITQL